MQSYQLHIVSQHLKRRHPYLEPPFKARYDPTEVYKAVFDRSIPKLIEILLTEDLPSNRYSSALITLNQIASDQVQKCNMIEAGVVGIASAFCHCKNTEIRRQATLLLGLLTSTVTGIKNMGKQTFEGLKALLFDQALEVRQAVAWTICRIVLSRVGVEILCKNQITGAIIESFMRYSGNKDSNQQFFIIYLLQAFKHLLVHDNGIKFCLNVGLTARLNELTSTVIYTKRDESNTRIHYLSLASLSNLAMNSEGKEECIKQRVILSAQKFLTSQHKQQVAHAVSLIMFSAVNLQGKKECTYNEQQKVTANILIKIIKLLDAEHDQIVKGDVRQTLKIISQQGDAFLAIADYMSRQCDLKHIEEIFGPSIIVPLGFLLPKSSQVADPPTLPSNKVNDYKAYTKTINQLMKKYPQATNIALQECVDLATKLIVFLCYRGDKTLQQGTVETLTKLAEGHQYSKKILKEYIALHGDTLHKISKTSIKNELKSYEQLARLLQIQ